jgi:hypothetical protein
VLQITEVFADTGEIVVRDMTPEELAQYEADAQATADAQAAADAAEAARVKAVQDAQAELKALGLTDAAVATISGYPYPYAPTA